MRKLSYPPLLVTRTANQPTMEGGDKRQHAASLVLLRLHEQGIGGKTHPAANEQN